ncbi:TraB/GumN family protein [Rhizobium sp.]
MSAVILKVTSGLDRAALDGFARRAYAAALAIPILLLLSLIMALAFAPLARAQEDPTCGGKDLVAELQAGNPAEYAKLRAEADKVKNSGTRLWKLEKPGQKPSWLLGTMHLSDPRVTSLPAEAQAAFDGAATLLIESDEVIDQNKAAARLMARPDLIYFSGKESIADYLSADEQKMLDEGLKARGASFAAMSRMKPWILASMVALPTCELSRKAKGLSFLDVKLAQQAQAQGKQVKGMETMAEQIGAMASLPMSFHVKSLLSVAKYPQYAVDMMETTLQLYLRGDIGMVMPATRYFSPEKEAADSAEMAMFEQKMITTRNYTMADRGAPILAEGNVFMAVGALHLPGDEGVVELLRKKGYTATAVK